MRSLVVLAPTNRCIPTLAYTVRQPQGTLASYSLRLRMASLRTAISMGSFHSMLPVLAAASRPSACCLFMARMSMRQG